MDIFLKVCRFFGEVLAAFSIVMLLVALFYVLPLMEYTA